MQLTTPLCQICLRRWRQVYCHDSCKIWGVWCCPPQGLWLQYSVPVFGQTDIENLFLKRSGMIYDTTNKKKNLPLEFTEFILVLHGILLLTHHLVSTNDIVFSTNWTSVTEHLQMFLKDDGTTEDVQAASRVLVAHRYNCNDKPLNTRITTRLTFVNRAYKNVI